MKRTEELFTIRRAGMEDLDSVMHLMNEIKAGMEHPEWYVTDQRPWVERHLEQEGFILVAERDAEELAGFFIVDFPAKRSCKAEPQNTGTTAGAAGTGSGAVPNDAPGENLGIEIRLNEQELNLVAHMDSAAVSPKYRGYHLQSILLEAVERELEDRPEQYFLCTVHPDNHASLHTMQRHGYVIVATKEKYGGLRRHVLYKKKEPKRRNDNHRVLVSACLLGVCCRYNGKGVLEQDVRELMEEAQLIPVCPEILGGLATPRDPAERVGDSVITKTGLDVTAQYRGGAEETRKLAELYDCNCAILKERSPSCGSGIIYDGTHTGTLIPGDGVTAELLKANGIPVFGESRVAECRIFLEKQSKKQQNQVQTGNASEKEDKDYMDGKENL